MKKSKKTERVKRQILNALDDDRRVKKRGNDLVIMIPKEIVRKEGIEEGQEIRLRFEILK